MDITNFHNLSASGLKVRAKVAFPDQPTHKELVHKYIEKLSLSSLKAYNDALSAFFTRHYLSQTGVQAANYLYAEFAKLSADNPNTAVSHFRHSDFPQPSIIARIEGQGPHKDEVVILSSHEDSTAGSQYKRSPGADDDGSGTMTVLEIFRVLMAEGWAPDRTVEFHTYAAEEAGLLGSQDVARAYQQAGVKVYAQMQLDMTIYPGRSGKGRFGVVTDYTSKELTAFVRLLVDTYSLLEWVDTKCGYACSDHASWYKAGYAACFPFEGPFSDSSPYIHSAEDTLDHYSLEHGLEFAKVAVGFLVELAGTTA